MAGLAVPRPGRAWVEGQCIRPGHGARPGCEGRGVGAPSMDQEQHKKDQGTLGWGEGHGPRCGA